MQKTYIKVLFLAMVVFTVSCTQKTTKEITKIENDIEVVKKSWRSSAPESAPAKPIKMGKYTQATLDNGLKIIVVENHKLPLVNFQISLDSPPMLEVEGGVDKNGYIDLSGALMASGTTSKTKAEIDLGVDNIGASLRTSGQGASGQCLTKHIDSYLGIFSDVVKNPSYIQEEFDKSVKRTISGIQSNQDDANSIVQNVRRKLVFGKNHPYGNFATISSVNNITLNDVKTYHKNTFYPKNAYLIIVGDVTASEAKEMAQKYFGDWKNPEAMPSFAPIPESLCPKAPSVDFVNKTGAVQSVINISYPINIKPGDDDAIKAKVMNAILGGGVFSSKLMQNLREDKAYTYGAGSSINVDPYQGSFNASASVRNEVTDSSIVEFLKELNSMRDELVSDEALNISQKYMIGTFSRSLTKPRTVAQMALATAKYNLPADYYEKYTERIQAVTKEDVMAMAKKYIKPENAHIVVVGSKAEAEKLVSFDDDQIISFYDVNGNFVKPAEEKIPEGHTAEIVIADFFDALGGKVKLEGIKDMTKIYTAELMGTVATFTSINMAPNKSFEKIGTDRMTMAENVFDGNTYSISGMQGSKKMTEGEEFDNAKLAANPIGQLNYNKEGFSIKLDGIDKVNGKGHYVVLVKKPTGSSVTEYYDVKTNLLSKSVESMEAQGQTMTMTIEYKDYEDVNGIMIASTVEISGMMPTTIVMKKKSILVNSGVDASLFEIK